jgi:hypothetical protein
MHLRGYKVSQVRSSVWAKVKALVRELVLVKKNTHTRSITLDTANDVIAAGDNCASAAQSKTVLPEKDVLFSQSPQETSLGQG